MGARFSPVPLIAARVRGPEAGRVKGRRSRSRVTQPKGAPFTRPTDPGYWPRQGGTNSQQRYLVRAARSRVWHAFRDGRSGSRQQDPLAQEREPVSSKCFTFQCPDAVDCSFCDSRAVRQGQSGGDGVEVGEQAIG